MGILNATSRRYHHNGQIELNESHWLVDKGISFYSPNDNVAVINNKLAIPSSGARTSVSDGAAPGRNLVIPGDGATMLVYGNSFQSNTPLTFVAWGYPTDLTTSHPLISAGTSGNNNNRFLLRFDGTAAGDPVSFVSRTVSNSIVTSSVAYTANKWQMATGVMVSSTEMRAYLNGDAEGVLSSGVVVPAGVLPNTAVAGSISSTPSYLATGAKVAHAMVLPWAMSADEVNRLYLEMQENPYQIIRKRRARVYSFPPLATGFKAAWAKNSNIMLGRR